MKNLSAKTAKRFKRFHQYGVERVTSIDLPEPKQLVRLGKCLAVEYESDKILHGKRKPRAYRHEIGAGVGVYTDPDGKCLYIIGGKFRVTDWMRG